ncbi:hypothetical protein [Aporhodopirellula aestuarii]|uniref:Hydrogenase maturation protease n=1 Tax=Aporhodopirellula aestuarii TaxID=2950107 RepID=A0ABT0TYY8_9BACT|nr:hypothetical protein [Aporhodopirellula aestuarii]MCM2369701.1 hypothetical protein [Aporhodopirellula aestuarii]
MNGNQARMTVIGIGSPHGDDQFGWSVVDHIANIGLQDVTLAKVGHPIDLIGSLEANDRVVLVDAGVGLPVDVPFRKLCFADAHDRNLIQTIRHRGTHDMGLASVLQMAQSLQKPTDHVTIWIGNGRSFDRLAGLTAPTEQAAIRCATLIAEELSDARNVAC